MPRNHEQEYRIAVLLRQVERTQARLDLARELSAMARQTLPVAHLLQHRQPMQEVEQQVLWELVRGRALNEASHEP